MKGKNLVLLWIVAWAFALVLAVPRSFNYQGKLLDASGAGVNDTLPITFRLYTSETGGSPIYEQTITNVIVRQGLFSVELSGFPDTVDFSAPYWLEVVVDGEAMVPREKLTSAPYALRARAVEEPAISYSSQADTTRRRGENIVFRTGPGATLEDDGRNINITLSVSGTGGGGATPNIYDVLVAGNDAGGRRIINLGNPDGSRDVATKAYVDSQSVSSISGGAGLLPDTPSKGEVTMSVNVDNSTIEIYDDKLRVRAGGITSNELADGAVISSRIAPGAITTTHIADSSIVSRQIAAGAVTINQLADFSISGANTGDMFYYDASLHRWVNMPTGANGQYLRANGPGNPPSWETPAARAIYNFILSASPSSGRIPRGDSATVSINATEVRGESPEYIRFYAAGLPTGATASFSPDSCQPSGGPPRACSSTMKIRTTGSASSGTYTIPITGVATGGATATAIYTANIGVPAKVTGVTVSGCYSNYINVRWSTPDDGGSPITHYNIYRSTSSGNEVYYTYVPAPTTTFRDTNVTAGTTYYYQVSAVNAVGEGDRSNEVNASVASSPLASCKAILDAGCSVGDGVYTIDPDGVGGNAPFQVYCDMTFDGGGWTYVASGCPTSTGAVGTPVTSDPSTYVSTWKLSDDVINMIRRSGTWEIWVQATNVHYSGSPKPGRLLRTNQNWTVAANMSGLEMWNGSSWVGAANYCTTTDRGPSMCQVSGTSQGWCFWDENKSSTFTAASDLRWYYSDWSNHCLIRCNNGDNVPQNGAGAHSTLIR